MVLVQLTTLFSLLDLLIKSVISSSYRQFQPTWLKNYPWLHYSSFSDGTFCRACAFFAPVAAGGHDLVTKPFRAWTKMSEKVGIHARKDYHLAALSRMDSIGMKIHPKLLM